MPRVLEAISDTNIGGAGVLLLSRLSHMDRKKYRVTVGLPKGSLLKGRLRAMGIPVVEVDGCYDRSLDLRSIHGWISLLRGLRPHIVHTHGCLSCRIAAKLVGVPVVIDTRHCAYQPSRLLSGFPGKFFCGLLLDATSDRTVAVAEAAKENLIAMGRNPRKITVIVNGAEAVEKCDAEERERLREQLRIPQDCFAVGMVARLEPCKGHKTLLQAAEILKGLGGSYCFLLVGDGTEREALKQYAEELGVRKSVRFCGFAEDVSPYYNAMDLNVNCSVGTETSSLALSEGMSLGLPAVASDYGGNPYMIRDGENGFLFPAGDSKALARRIRQIREDRALYDRLSRGARKRFLEELNVRRMTRETEALYAAMWESYLRSRQSK